MKSPPRPRRSARSRVDENRRRIVTVALRFRRYRRFVEGGGSTPHPGWGDGRLGSRRLVPQHAAALRATARPRPTTRPRSGCRSPPTAATLQSPPVSTHGIFRTPTPYNEPIKDYAPGSPEREELRTKLAELAGQTLELPLVIGGKDVALGETFDQVAPHDTDRVLARVSKGDAEHVQQAIDAASAAWHDWSRTPWEERAAVFLRAAELLAGPVARDAERGDDARPVEDRAPGGDRRRLRADRLLALQRRVHAPDLRGPADLLARASGTGWSTARSRASSSP